MSVRTVRTASGGGSVDDEHSWDENDEERGAPQEEQTPISLRTAHRLGWILWSFVFSYTFVFASIFTVWFVRLLMHGGQFDGLFLLSFGVVFINVTVFCLAHCAVNANRTGQSPFEWMNDPTWEDEPMTRTGQHHTRLPTRPSPLEKNDDNAAAFELPPTTKLVGGGGGGGDGAGGYASSSLADCEATFA